jgi:hypothetical protein
MPDRTNRIRLASMVAGTMLFGLVAAPGRVSGRVQLLAGALGRRSGSLVCVWGGGGDSGIDATGRHR